MLHNWLKPIIHDSNDFERFQLGHSIAVFKKDFPKLSRIKVALVGIDKASAKAIRTRFYQLSNHFEQLGIADLGNVRKKEVSFIIPIIRELIASGITPILIGLDNKEIQIQLQAHRQQKSTPAHWLAVDDRIRWSPEKEAVFFSQIGGQMHFMSPYFMQQMEEILFDYVGLGRARANIPALEPIIRTADFASIHLAALKLIEAQAQESPSPSGFFLEEVCRITRYAGMSDKLQSIGFYGYKEKQDKEGFSAQAIAQMIWYFIDGLYNRKNDYPASMDGMTEYIVQLREYDTQVTFWKSQKSGRWWLQLPARTEGNFLIPCSYDDYKQAGWGEVSDRILHILRRFP